MKGKAAKEEVVGNVDKSMCLFTVELLDIAKLDLRQPIP